MGCKGCWFMKVVKASLSWFILSSLYMYSSNNALSRLGFHVSIAQNSDPKGSIALGVAYRHEVIQLGSYQPPGHRRKSFPKSPCNHPVKIIHRYKSLEIIRRTPSN